MKFLTKLLAPALALFGLCHSLEMRAQVNIPFTQTPSLLDPLNLPSNLDKQVESMLEQWYSGYGRMGSPRLGTDIRERLSVPYVSDSTYIHMLNRIPSAMHFSYNPLVREAIELFVYKRRSLLNSMLSLADLYYPEIEVALDKNDLPLELRYLIIVESGMNPQAISPAGAAGLWQLMLPTAKAYGLTINSLVDERMDPIKSTEAACRVLRDLYKVYKDWWLVLAAYNCGPGSVNRALKRVGSENPNFWAIYNFLPRETRRYIPLFIGVYFAMHYHKQYGITARQLGRPLSTDYYRVEHRVTFDRIAELTGLDKGLIGSFNPQFRRGIVPGSSLTPYSLRLPLSAVIELDKVSEQISSPELRVSLEGPNTPPRSAAKATRDSVPEPADKPTQRNKGKQLAKVEEETPSTNSRTSKRDKQRKQKQEAAAARITTHIVRSGETLYSLAKKYKISVDELRRVNGIKGSALSIGQRIKIEKK